MWFFCIVIVYIFVYSKQTADLSEQWNAGKEKWVNIKGAVKPNEETMSVLEREGEL